jgi:hypothetical protein
MLLWMLFVMFLVGVLLVMMLFLDCRFGLRFFIIRFLVLSLRIFGGDFKILSSYILFLSFWLLCLGFFKDVWLRVKDGGGLSKELFSFVRET